MTAGLVEIPQAELAALAAAYDPQDDWSDNPQGWLADYLGEYAWQTQREIWTTVEHNDRTAVLSCNNSGKTWLAARIIVRWVVEHWREGVRVVTTAPTAAQVSLLLWQEVRAAAQKARNLEKKVPGRILSSPYPQWKIGDQVVAFGRKPSDHEQSAMQGVHAPHVLFVIDEAGGVAQSIWDAAEKVTTTGHAAILAIGNPDDINSPFGRVTRPGSGWQVIRVDGLRTPNFTADRVGPLTAALMRHEGIPFNSEPVPDTMRPVMLSPTWVEGGLVRWCGVPPDVLDRMSPEDAGQFIADRADASQLFTAAVRGRFPVNTGESAIPLAWVLRAVERWKQWLVGDADRDIPPRAEPVGRRVVGIDVATPNGADETCIAVRQGDVVQSVNVYPEADTEDTIGYAWQHCDGIPLAIAVPDVIGIGAGVADGLQRRSSVSVVRFNAAAQSDRRDRHNAYRFANDRAAAWWRVRELLDPAYGSTLALPDDEQLIADLTSARWTVKIGRGVGVIHIEPKDKIRKRLGHSPDRADSVIQSLWVDGAASGTGPDDVPAIPWGGAEGAAKPPPDRRSGVVAYQLDGDAEDEW